MARWNMTRRATRTTTAMAATRVMAATRATRVMAATAEWTWLRGAFRWSHGGHESHEGHGGHGGMDMAPGGIPLAQGGDDRHGLEMDVLHLALGPVLPFWPAGLVLRCSLQGDVVVGAEAAVIDGGGYGTPVQAKRP